MRAFTSLFMLKNMVETKFSKDCFLSQQFDVVNPS